MKMAGNQSPTDESENELEADEIEDDINERTQDNLITDVALIKHD
jgi:hypothetical protein